jgi:ATP-binding cassette, subfamily B, bacterial MsbA
LKELTRMLALVRPYMLALLISVVLMAIAGAAHGAMPLLIGPVFDFVLRPQAPDMPVKLLTIPGWHKDVFLGDFIPSGIHNVWSMVAFALLTVFVTKGLCDYAGNYLINYVGFSAVTDLRQRIFDRLLRQDATFFESTSTGHLMSSVMNDIDKMQLATSQMLADWLRQSFSAMGLLVVVLRTDWKLAAVSLTVLPFVIVPTVRIGRRIRRTTRRTQDYTAELSQILQETISGSQVVRSFSTEDIESKRFHTAAARLKRSNLKYTLQQAIASPLIEFFGAVTIVGLLTYARTQIKAGAMTTGDFVGFVVALLMLYEPVKRLTGIHNIFQQALGASQKVFEYLDLPRTVDNRPGAVKLARFEKGIQFDQVQFRYPQSAALVLNGVSIDVPAASVLALVGPSGAGKTTLANLVPRFHDVIGGAIRLDGRDVRDLTLESLRAKIGIVAQETFLFNDTVAHNIAYGRPQAAPAEVQAAARNAMAEEFILKLPRGYDTMIGERGTKLSGGQRQRIAIARALLKDAPILILDEATSHLDSESELLVQGALANLIANRTVIVIAHRLSTIRRADRIVVLDRGEVVETGTHDELVVRGGLYQRLHELQFLESPDPMVNP